MNDEIWTAFIGFGGSLVGAGAALLGTLLTLRKTIEAERAARIEENRRLHQHDLKEAYVEWLHAAHKVLHMTIETGHTVFDRAVNRGVNPHFTHEVVPAQSCTRQGALTP